MFAPTTADPLSKAFGAAKALFHHSKTGHPLDEDTMLKYFLSQLDVRAKFIAPRIAGDAQREDLLNTVRTELSTFFERHTSSHANLADDAWNQGYYLERLLALIEPSDTLSERFSDAWTRQPTKKSQPHLVFARSSRR